MNRQTLLSLATRRGPSGGVALVAAAGDSTAKKILRDAIDDEGGTLLFDSLKVGNNCLVETVTQYWYGTVISHDDLEIVLKPCAWIPDTGRFNEFVKTGEAAEVEPCGDHPVIVPVGMVTAIVVLPHKVPNKTKGG